jgi:hypothetical protein
MASREMGSGAPGGIDRGENRWRGRDQGRRRFLTAAGGVLAALAGCISGSAIGPVLGQYVGRSSTLVEQLDASGQSGGIRRYQLPVTVVIDRPASAGGLTESNPFNLLVAPTTPGAEGAIEVWSAFPALDPRDGREVLIQYWELRLARGDVTGRLVDNHTAEGAALNLINIARTVAPNVPEMTMPAAMAVGTVLEGTIRSREVRLRIQGNTTDRTRPFLSEVTASRS